jgi:hypothetical protein
MMAAIAGVGRLLRELPELARRPAFRADERFSESQIEQMRDARVIVRELLEEILDGLRLRHARPQSTRNLALRRTYVNFIG